MKSPVPVVMSYSGSSMPSGSMPTTFSLLWDLTARPSIERLRVIAGSVRWKKRSCCSRPPRMRTFHFCSPVALDDERQAQAAARERRPVDDLRVRVADPDAAAAAEVALGVVDAGEEALVPLVGRPTRPGDVLADRLDGARPRRADPVDLAVVAVCRGEAEARRLDAEVVQVDLRPGQRLEVREGESEPVERLRRGRRGIVRAGYRGSRRRGPFRTGSPACSPCCRAAPARTRRCPPACC